MANRWSREALRLAEKVALRMKHGELTTAHVFVGLVQQGGPVNKVVTSHNGVTLSRLHQVVRVVGTTGVGILPGGSVKYTAAVNEALKLAEGRANELQHADGAMREDIMVALLMQRDDYFVDTLARLKLDRDKLLYAFAADLVDS